MWPPDNPGITHSDMAINPEQEYLMKKELMRREKLDNLEARVIDLKRRVDYLGTFTRAE